MSTLFSINFVLFTALGCQVSALELIGIISGLASVYYAARMRLLTWSIGMVNIAAFFLFFYQVRLYAEMLLQIFFAVLTIYGWLTWKNVEISPPVPVRLSGRIRAAYAIGTVVITAILFQILSTIHRTLPEMFPTPAAAPFLDSLVTALSMVATLMLGARAIESWALWITIDILCVYLYLMRDIPFMSALYGIFAVIATFGLHRWLIAMKDSDLQRTSTETATP